MEKVLVAGATGFLGRHVVKALKKEGYHVSVLVRNKDKLKRRGNYMEPAIDKEVDRVITAEITKPITLEGVCEGIDYVFSSVGITRQRDGLTFHEVDYEGNTNLLREAENSNVKKFMYIHVLRGDVFEGPMTEAKEKFAKELIRSKLVHLVIRPTGYFSDMTEFLNLAIKGRAFLIGKGINKLNPIHGEDLAKFCVESFKLYSSEVLDVGGPEILTHQQIAKMAFKVIGEKEKITYLPTVLFPPMLKVYKMINKQQYGIFLFFYQGMTQNMIAPKYGSLSLEDFFVQYLNKKIATHSPSKSI
ncbi:SDR family oxidoreductase [Cytobacillus sp. IB215665]|uniref:SDR family oxidoreductase n=1 Tax=Cytobacillus sp. IB215665 TaxID=3097357 RepID=UPI002A158DFD|nr:SDR family oxidoreductase [Cytobacillus sp. IB215665]MDX8366901.1 SDR family oxidoreductase [Cytobacillus sp. IB215665]